MKNKIDTIIFDLGGVLLNIDYDAPVREFKRLGIDQFDHLYSKAQQNFLFDRFETGEISDAAFRDGLREVCGKQLSDAEIDFAWNSILLDFPPHRINMLTELRKEYRLILLSNTNEIHIRAFEQELMRTYSKNIIQELFDIVHYSSRLGLRKPHTETFLHVIKTNGLIAEATVFIDDSMQHVEGAKRAGLNSYWLNVKNDDIVDVIYKMI